MEETGGNLRFHAKKASTSAAKAVQERPDEEMGEEEIERIERRKMSKEGDGSDEKRGKREGGSSAASAEGPSQQDLDGG